MCCFLFITGVTVGLQQTSYAFEEDGPIMSVCVELSGQTDTSVAVSLATRVDGDAQGVCILNSMPPIVCAIIVTTASHHL